MSEASLLRRFGAAVRDYGWRPALRATGQKIVGRLLPGRAVKPPEAWPETPRALTILLDDTAHDAATIAAAVAVVEAEGAAGRWEICLRHSSACERAVAELVSRLRGTRPWLRIVDTGSAGDDAEARRWTVEQASGADVLLLAPDQALPRGLAERLAQALGDAPRGRCAALDAPADAPARCRALMLAKSDFLASFDGRFPLVACEAAEALPRAGLTVIDVSHLATGGGD